MKFWEKLLDYIAKVLPNILAAFGIGYSIGEAGKDKVKDELLDQKLKSGLEQNKLKTALKRVTQLPSDIIKRAISRGKSLRKPDDGDVS